MRILVTGANGFVGTAVCRKLSQAGFFVRAGLRSADLWFKLHESVPEVKDFAVLGNLGETPDLTSAADDVDVVVHLAARVHIMRDRAVNPLQEFRQVNVLGSEALASRCSDRGVRRLIFLSTIKVHGESTPGLPFTENSPLDPQDPYSVSKCEAEESLRSIGANQGMEVVILRPPLVYGPGVRANFMRLMNLIDRRLPLPLPDTKNQRSLIAVGNLADLIFKCIDHPDAANETFMASDGEDVSAHELAVRLGRVLSRPVRFLPVPARLIRVTAKMLGKEAAANRLMDSLTLSSNKARHMLGWTPPLTLDEGLANTAEWYRNSSKERA